MRLVCDIEADSLNPKVIWVICTKDIDTLETRTFIRPDLFPQQFEEYVKDCKVWIGHHFIGFDYLAINALVGSMAIRPESIVDTLVVSRLVATSRQGHSLEDYGEEFGVAKVQNENWSQLTDNMIKRCQIPEIH